jgi:hypothetical protein
MDRLLETNQFDIFLVCPFLYLYLFLPRQTREAKWVKAFVESSYADYQLLRHGFYLFFVTVCICRANNLWGNSMRGMLKVF